MRVLTVTLGPFQMNSHFACLEGSRAILFDAGHQPDELLRFAEAQALRIGAILITHGHGDHIVGAEWLRREVGCPLYFPEGDRILVTGSFYGVTYDPPQPDVLVRGGEQIEVLGLGIDVLSVPGHSPGHVAYRIGRDLFSGDCLFRGSVGRTDLEHADWRVLRASLERLLDLPDDTIVHPGHGPDTTIGRERFDNPFLEP